VESPPGATRRVGVTKMRRIFSGALLVVPVCLLSSCVIGPRYTRQTIVTPPAFRGEAGAAQQSSIADLPWWEVFHDDTLRSLIKTALTNNQDLRIAALRVEQARQLSVQARSQYYPSVGYEAGLSQGKNEYQGVPSSSGGLRRGSVLAGFGATWELDLWGRIRWANEAALANFLSTEQGRRGVMLSLVSNVAQAYFELLEFDLRLDIARRNTASFEDSLKLFRERLNGGTASRLETSRAEAAMASTAANIPDLERQIAIQENEIRLLIGTDPGPIPHRGTLLEQTVPPDVPAGLPSILLERRPDIVQAELAVRAANAQVGIASTAFFPQIGLTDLLGRASSPLAAFTSGTNSVWSTASNVVGPIYEGPSLRAQKRQAIAHWQETRIQYERAALGAFRDVSNALFNRLKLEDVRSRQAEAVKAYQEAVEVAVQRYAAGKSGYYEVLEAQQELFPAENALAETELGRRLAIVQLYQALGGGWSLSNADWTAPPAPNPKQ
jgi:multidrug efflux system outer membrane protein